MVKKRASVERPYACWTMSAAEFKSHIVSALRNASKWWKPKQVAIKRANIGRWLYKCELCWEVGPASLPPLPWKKRKRKNIQADHIIPCVWNEWWVSYDSFIERMFVEPPAYQAICYECHSKKTKEENAGRRSNK